MTLNLTEHERDYLCELLEAALKEKLHELHHTDSREYRALLREKVAVIEALTARIARSEIPS